MDAGAEEFCRNFEACVRLQPLKRDTPLQSTPLPEQCWGKCAVDLVGPFPDQRYIFTLVDYRSKWQEASILTNITSKDIIKCLTESFARFGNPKTIIKVTEIDRDPPLDLSPAKTAVDVSREVSSKNQYEQGKLRRSQRVPKPNKHPDFVHN